jgi:hypothetical protein
MPIIDNYKQTTYLHLCDNYVIIGKTFFQTFWKKIVQLNVRYFEVTQVHKKTKIEKFHFVCQMGQVQKIQKNIFVMFFLNNKEMLLISELEQ